MVLEEINIVDTITDYYNRFENEYPIELINSKQFDTPVNFKQAKGCPKHRWFTYKEGFSPIFVADFIQRFSSLKSTVVFDPFGGIGTTVLESSILGYSAFSNDINPLSNYISKIKNTIYDSNDITNLESTLKVFNKINFDRKNNPPVNNTVNSYFDESTLDSILQIQYWIDTLEIPKIKNLFNLALLTNLEKVSTHRKDGNGVKRKKNFNQIKDLSVLKDIISEKINEFLHDINSTKINSLGVVYEQSSFDPYSLPKKADIVITSPPYANCFDYSKVYLVELWFGGFFKEKIDQKNFRESSVVSHVHYKWQARNRDYGHNLVNNEIFKHLSECELWDKKIPQMLVGYFSDMGKVLSELIPNLKSGAIVGIVVGNSVYGGLPIATDILISELAIQLGYEIVGIESYRTLTPSSQQLKIIREKDKKFLRESLIILQWK
ncbi:hypothetical protein [Labilibaculum sp.]|uniref:hypothetical protein n=1 Tax=Labilibaculum sp. TaxID=2060723 RepID=UPI00356919DB